MTNRPHIDANCKFAGYEFPAWRIETTERDNCTARFVRAMTHWLRGEDTAAKAWLEAALLWAPAAS